jgi:hypothetical protein
MADMTIRDETTTRRIYTLQSPTNWAEVSKVLGALQQDEDRRKRGDWDDAVIVEAWDDEIRFSFEVSKE